MFRISMAMFFAMTAAAAAQSFSCSIGQPACLNYGDKVCNQFAKCVSDDAQCFDGATCYPDGFVCKSDMDDLAKKAKRIASHYDDLRNCLSTANDMDDMQFCILQDLRFGG